MFVREPFKIASNSQSLLCARAVIAGNKNASFETRHRRDGYGMTLEQARRLDDGHDDPAPSPPVHEENSFGAVPPISRRKAVQPSYTAHQVQNTQARADETIVALPGAFASAIHHGRDRNACNHSIGALFIFLEVSESTKPFFQAKQPDNGFRALIAQVCE
jgi:hypothetical protein